MKFLDYFTGSVFQVFDDKGREENKSRARVYLEYNEQVFKDLNAEGFGIYFTPNFCKGGRTKNHLIKLNCIFADLDVAKEGDGTVDTVDRKKILHKALLKDKLVPNFVIDTKNGLQPLWLLEDEPLTEENKKEFVFGIQGIIEWSKKFGAKGDQVKDLVHVLRLPNFYHMKGEPYLCRAVNYHLNKISLSLIREAFPFEEKKVEIKPEKKFKQGLISQEIDRLDFQELVIRAFAFVNRRAEFDDQCRLILDGRLTGTFQGKNGDRQFLASSSHEPFKGNKITVVADILGVTNKEAFAWIKEQYNLSEFKMKAREVIANIKPIQEKKIEKYYTWGTKILTENFAPIKRNTSIVLVGETGDGKSTFAFDMAIKNAELEHKVLYISLEMTEKELWENIARSYCKMTIAEEIHQNVPENKQKAFDRKIEELKNIKNLTTKGIVGTEGINWEGCVELMKGNWDLIFIDNLDLIQGEEREQDWERQKRISAKILNYCNDNQVPIVLLHHYRKKQGATVRSVHDISGSAKITHNAHRVIMLSRIKGEWEALSDKEKATLNLLLDKARGYNRAYKTIYFYRGSFYDEYPKDEFDYTNPEWWNK